MEKPFSTGLILIYIYLGGGRRENLQESTLTSSMWALGFKLRSSGLVASTFIHQGFSPLPQKCLNNSVCVQVKIQLIRMMWNLNGLTLTAVSQLSSSYRPNSLSVCGSTEVHSGEQQVHQAYRAWVRSHRHECG